MKKKVFLLTCLLVFSVSVFAQSNSAAERSKKLTQMNAQMAGTYQIQMINTRALPMMPLSLLPQIDSLRKDNDTVYITVNNTERIMVLPKKVITSPGFAEPEHAIYISTQ